MHIYPRLKDLREDEDLTQKEFAKIMQLTQQQYSEYERGKREIPFFKVIEFAKFYGVSLDYIAGITKDKNGMHKTDLNDDEKNIVEKWSVLTERQKGKVDLFIDQLIEK